MKYLFKTYWFEVVVTVLCAYLTWLVMPIAKDHAMQHQRIESLFGWSKAQVIIAPNLPCTNCGNTVFQLHNVADLNTVTAVCCLCGVSHVQIDCHNNEAIAGLKRIFKQKMSEFKIDTGDYGYVPGHIYYQHERRIK